MVASRISGVWLTTLIIFMLSVVIFALLALGVGLGMIFVDEALAAVGIGLVLTLSFVAFFVQLLQKKKMLR